MKRRNPYPGVTRTVDRHGKPRWRFRMKGRAGCYLPGEYDSKEFRKAYEEAVAGAVIVASPVQFAHGSFDWLCEQYFRTPAWQKIGPVYRKKLSAEIARFRAKWGTALVADLRSRHVEAIIAKLADRPAAANSMLKLIRRLCRFGIKRSLIQTDPTIGVERYATNPDGYHTWTDDEIETFIAHHGRGSKPVLALLLMLWTGAARQDVITLGWQNVKQGRIAYRRKKTGGDVDLGLAMMPELMTALADLPRDRLLFLGWGETGRAYSPAGFGNRFAEWCALAGLKHCSAHGLRKAGATRLANTGSCRPSLDIGPPTRRGPTSRSSTERSSATAA